MRCRFSRCLACQADHFGSNRRLPVLLHGKRVLLVPGRSDCRLSSTFPPSFLSSSSSDCFAYFSPQLRDGQTVFARAIFNDALSKNKLSYTFDSPVSEIQDFNGLVKVVTSTGTFEASKVICTTPLNVTNQIKFSPPLSADRKEAFDVGSVAFAHKIHVVMSKPALRSKAWSSYDTREPVGMASAVGVDYTHDKKSSILVAFGAFPLPLRFRLN